MGKFLLDCEKPNIGEFLTYTYLKLNNINYIDVTKEKKYQDESIDFIIISNGAFIPIEVKYSIKYPHTIFCEET